MPLESASFISSLSTADPLSSDPRAQGDDHLRLLKTVLRTTFPNAGRAVYFRSSIAAKTSNYSVATPTDDGKLIPVDTTSGSVTITLPSPSYDGFEVSIVKKDFSVNTVVLSAAASINGQSTVVIATPYALVSCIWSSTLSTWVCNVPPHIPIGSLIYGTDGTNIPDGWLPANGRTFGNTSSGAVYAGSRYLGLYQHLWNYDSGITVTGSKGASASADFAANKAMTLPDLRGRVIAGMDTLFGSTDAGRIGTVLTGRNSVGGVGGAQQITLTSTEMPAHTHTVSGTTNEDTHSHDYQTAQNSNNFNVESEQSALRLLGTEQTSEDTHSHTVTGTAASAGGGAAHNNLQPTMVRPIYIKY